MTNTNIVSRFDAMGNKIAVSHCPINSNMSNANECHSHKRRRRSSHPARCARRRRTVWPAASAVRRSSPMRTTRRFAFDKSFLSWFMGDVLGCDRGCISRAYDAQPTTVMCYARVVMGRRLDIHKIHAWLCYDTILQYSVKKIEIDLDKHFNSSLRRCLCVLIDGVR
jgi:hypothetical protein